VPVPLVIFTVALVAVVLVIVQTLFVTNPKEMVFPDAPPVAITVKLEL
jgi:hypothetical protein